MPRKDSTKQSESRNSDRRSVATRRDKGIESETEDVDDVSQEDLAMADDEEELNKLVLGDGDDFLTELGKAADEDDDMDSEADLQAQLGLDEDGEGGEGLDDADLFFFDGDGTAPDSTALIPKPASEDGQSDSEAPAWEDSDDDRLVVSLATHNRLRKLRVFEGEDLVSGKDYTKRLRQQFLRLNPAPEWASERPAKRRRRSSASSNSSYDSNGMDSDSEDLTTLPLARLLQDSGSLVRNTTTKRTKLRAEVIDIQRCRDIPDVMPSTVGSLSFHPQYPVLLSSGLASTLYMHHISNTALPKPHPMITSVHVKKTPIHTSAFLGSEGEKIFFSGRRRYFHTWDLPSGNIQKITRVMGHKDEQKTMENFNLSPCGRYMALQASSRKGGGIINILDAVTTQWIAAARIEGKNGVADFVWWSDGEGLTIAGKGGEVGEWSVESRSFLALWNDEGAAGTTVLALGGRSGNNALGGDRWIVVGSQSGVVNIYDRRTWTEGDGVLNIPKRPEPTKRFMQLTTPTSVMQISQDGQLLVFASRWKRNALRLVHLPSCTVYRNWPTDKTPFGRVTAVAFGRDANDGTVLAVGNEAGNIRLWEIRA